MRLAAIAGFNVFFVDSRRNMARTGSDFFVGPSQQGCFQGALKRPAWLKGVPLKGGLTHWFLSDANYQTAQNPHPNQALNGADSWHTEPG